VVTTACWITVLGYAAQAPANDNPVCTLTPLHTGVCQLGADHVLGPDHSADERMTFAIYSFLVKAQTVRKSWWISDRRRPST